jgi:hypothetical protein
VVQVVWHFPTKLNNLKSNPDNAKEKKKKKEKLLLKSSQNGRENNTL